MVIWRRPGITVSLHGFEARVSADGRLVWLQSVSITPSMIPSQELRRYAEFISVVAEIIDSQTALHTATAKGAVLSDS